MNKENQTKTFVDLARQIKKAREEFLCIPGADEITITATSSVGDLPFKNGNSFFWKRKLEKTMKKSASSNEGFRNVPKERNEAKKKWQKGYIFEIGENTQNTSNTNESNSEYLSQDNTTTSKSYSCPSSPKL